MITEKRLNDLEEACDCKSNWKEPMMSAELVRMLIGEIRSLRAELVSERFYENEIPSKHQNGPECLECTAPATNGLYCAEHAPGGVR